MYSSLTALAQLSQTKDRAGAGRLLRQAPWIRSVRLAPPLVEITRVCGGLVVIHSANTAATTIFGFSQDLTDGFSEFAFTPNAHGLVLDGRMPLPRPTSEGVRTKIAVGGEMVLAEAGATQQAMAVAETERFVELVLKVPAGTNIAVSESHLHYLVAGESRGEFTVTDDSFSELLRL